jgi:predicted ATPase
MPSNWYVLTSAPGVGKTVLLNELSRRGFAVVPEAATDVIERLRRAGVAEPRTLVDFVDQVLAEQLVRARRADRFGPSRPVIFDRSPVCTLALARWSGQAPSPALVRAAASARDDYAGAAFLVADLGFVERTAARRISYSAARAFGQLHVEAYRECGFALTHVPANPVPMRADLVESTIRGWSEEADARRRHAQRAADLTPHASEVG